MPLLLEGALTAATQLALLRMLPVEALTSEAPVLEPPVPVPEPQALEPPALELELPVP